MKDGLVSMDELAAQVKEVEGIIVGLESEAEDLVRAYPLTRPSLGRMRGAEWLAQFKKWYPGIDVTFPSEGLTLADLRRRTWP